MASDEPEALSELLEGLGAVSTVIRGGALLRETAEDRTESWESALVAGIFPADVEVPGVLREVQRCFDLHEPPKFTVTKVEETHPQVVLDRAANACVIYACAYASEHRSDGEKV